MKTLPVNWRRGLGLNYVTTAADVRPVTLEEAETAYKRLYEEANLLDGTKKYGMHVALHAFITKAREELSS